MYSKVLRPQWNGHNGMDLLVAKPSRFRAISFIEGIFTPKTLRVLCLDT